MTERRASGPWRFCPPPSGGNLGIFCPRRSSAGRSARPKTGLPVRCHVGDSPSLGLAYPSPARECRVTHEAVKTAFGGELKELLEIATTRNHPQARDAALS